MVSSPPSHTRSRGLVVAVATLATAVLLSLVLYAGAPDAPRSAAAGGRFVSLEQVPVQLSLSVLHYTPLPPPHVLIRDYRLLPDKCFSLAKQ